MQSSNVQSLGVQSPSVQSSRVQASRVHASRCPEHKRPDHESRDQLFWYAVKATDYFRNLFEISQFNWKIIHFLIGNTTLDTKVSLFQYKVLYNVLFANKMLFKLGKITSTLCSFCQIHNGTIMHCSYDCLIANSIWNQLKSILLNNLIFPIRTPQSAIFGFSDLDTNEYLFLNHLLHNYKMYIYNARTTCYLNASYLQKA